MGLIKREYIDQETVITADNMNDIQDAVIALEDGLFSVDNDKSGEVITITDAAKRGFRSLNIFGKTTQDGTPTPDAPVELVSAGDSGSITVSVIGDNDSQKLNIATPNGLPGIPVKSGGNHTDANGQQWICDEIDFARGVYVKRCGKLSASQMKSSTHLEFTNCVRVGCVLTPNSVYSPNGLSQHLPMIGDYTLDTPHFYAQGSVLYLFAPVSALAEKSASGVIAWAKELGIEFTYILEAPIETPLSEEELAAYANLHTYKDNTTVSNDAGAWMELEYVMDAKKYIDSLVTGGIAPARVE
jgi:hypothetical protein